MKRTFAQRFWRFVFYIVGLSLLAFGVNITNLADLGVAPFVSVHYGISRIWNLNFPTLAFCVYLVLVAAQLILKGRQRSWWDLLQVPFALLFSVLLEICGRPLTFQPQTLGHSIGLFCIGILCTDIQLFFRNFRCLLFPLYSQFRFLMIHGVIPLKKMSAAEKHENVSPQQTF